MQADHRREALVRAGNLALVRLGEYTRKYTMSTSVHIPKPLLDALDRRARARRLSRNRLILKAIERELTSGPEWTEGFFERLIEVDASTAATADEMLQTIRTNRRSREPRQL